MLRPHEIATILYVLQASGDAWEVNKPGASDMFDYTRISLRTTDLYCALEELFQRLAEITPGGLNDEEFQQVFYDVGKKFFGKDGLRRFFQDIYLLLTRRVDHGSRLGTIVRIIGVEKFKMQLMRPMLFGI